jgi:hypothetical protein
MSDGNSTICGVWEMSKGGAAFSCTKVLGHPLLIAVRARTGALLDVRMRKGAART